jgi:hypothetical protein
LNGIYEYYKLTFLRRAMNHDKFFLLCTCSEVYVIHFEVKDNGASWALVAHICNPSYSGGRDQEDYGLKKA